MPAARLDAPHAEYLSGQQRGLLATVAPNGTPQNKPVGFRYDAERGTIDISGINMEQSAKFRNIAVRPQVAFTVQDVPDEGAGADGVRFMEIRGTAEQVELEAPPCDRADRWRRRTSAGGRRAPGRRAPGGSRRPRRRGLHRHFADDVMWGSPYGATVDGYDALHAIHQRLHASSQHGNSRYEIVRVLTPTPDVVLAQVRRTTLDERGEAIPSLEGEPRFSEMALYVLVRREGEWWLAAGQNTVVVADRGAVRQDVSR